MSALWKRGTDAAGASGAAKTSQTYLLGVGASGALLAGAGVALISLVGLVSFDVWPGTPVGGGAQEEAQLSIGGSAGGPGVSLSEVVDVLSAGTPIGTAGAPASDGVAPDTSEKRPPKAAKPAPANPAPTAPPAPGPGVGDGGGGGNGNGSGSGSGSSGNPGGGNPATPTQTRNPNARSDPGRPATNPPAHSRGGGNGNGNRSGGSSRQSGVTSQSTQSDAPGSSGSGSSSNPGLGKGR